jgi:hypothetical protein
MSSINVIEQSTLIPKKGVERKHSCAEITHGKNTTLGNPNTINSNKIHH